MIFWNDEWSELKRSQLRDIFLQDNTPSHPANHTIDNLAKNIEFICEENENNIQASEKS